MRRYTWLGVALCLLSVLSPAALLAQQAPPEGRLAINHAPFNRPQRRGAPLIIEATITAPAGVRKAQVFCRALGGGDFTALLMEEVAEQRYRAVVPDWLTAGQGLEYYITATDERGQSTSQGFVGFPLAVQFGAGQAPTQEDRLKALQETLDVLRKGKEQNPGPPTSTPGGNSNRYR